MFGDEVILFVDDIVLLGVYNLENILVVVVVVKMVGVFNKVIQKVLISFIGVKYCLQYVIVIQNCKFYNDSKVMNILVISKVFFVFKVLVILFVGGFDCGNGFDDLKLYMDNVKVVFMFGQIVLKIEKLGNELGI